jgi:hypothetical protein
MSRGYHWHVPALLVSLRTRRGLMSYPASNLATAARSYVLLWFTIRQQVRGYNELYLAPRVHRIRIIKVPDLGLHGVEFQPDMTSQNCAKLSCLARQRSEFSLWQFGSNHSLWRFGSEHSLWRLGSDHHLWRFGSDQPIPDWTPPSWFIRQLGRPVGP